MAIPPPDLGDSLEGSSRISPTGPSPSPQQGPQQQAPSRSFAPLMQPPTPEQAAPAGGPSPMELAGAAGAGGPASYSSINAQAAALQGNSQKLQAGLTDPVFNSMSDGQKSLIHTKLGQYLQNIQSASERMGSSYKPNIPSSDTAMSSIKSWVSMLADGSNQLSNFGGIVNSAQQNGKAMSAADMLRIQANMSSAERAINFCSAVVGKVTSAIQTLGQTQL
jgi:hypothetical protein